MDDERIDYEQLRFRVEQKIQREKRQKRLGLLIPNILLFVVFMLTAWVVVPAASSRIIVTDDLIGMMLLLSVGWGTGLVLHIIAFYMETDAYKRRLMNRYMAQEVADEQARLDSYGDYKRKRGRMELGEDGELVEIVVEDEPKAKPQREG